MKNFFFYTHLVTFVCLFGSVVNAEPCNEDWTWYNEYCYKLFDGASNNFDEAESTCNTAYGGHLASITTLNENAFVYGLLNYGSGASGQNAWIGARDIDETNTGVITDWVWYEAAGAGNVIGYNNWASDEPDNVNGRSNAPSYCGAMKFTTAQWVDYPCETPLSFICKTEQNIGAILVINPFSEAGMNILQNHETAMVIKTYPAQEGTELLVTFEGESSNVCQIAAIEYDSFMQVIMTAGEFSVNSIVVSTDANGEAWIEVLCEYGAGELTVTLWNGYGYLPTFITAGTAVDLFVYYGMMVVDPDNPYQLADGTYVLPISLSLAGTPTDTALTAQVQAEYDSVCILAPGGMHPLTLTGTSGPMNVEITDNGVVWVNLVCQELYSFGDCENEGCVFFPDTCVGTATTPCSWAQSAAGDYFCSCQTPQRTIGSPIDYVGAIVINDEDFDDPIDGGAQVGVERTVTISLDPHDTFTLANPVDLEVSIGQSENCILSFEGASSSPLVVTFPVGITSQDVSILCSNAYDGEENKMFVQQTGTVYEQYAAVVAELRTSLLVFDVPDPPERPSAMSFETQEALFAFLPPLNDNNAAVTDYTIYWERVEPLGSDSSSTGVVSGNADGMCSLVANRVSCQKTLYGLENDEFYRISVTATNRAGESAPSDEVMVKVFPSLPAPTGCPIDSEDVFGPVSVYTTENDAGEEQLSVIVSWYLLYNAPMVCDGCYKSAPLQIVEFEFGDRSCSDECRIANPDDYANVGCADVFDVEVTCPGWAFARLDLNMHDEMLAANSDQCGFSMTTSDDGLYLEYTIDLIETAELLTESVFGEAPLRSETIIRQITVRWPITVEATLEPSDIYGEPIRELFPISVIDVIQQIHTLEITTRTQYPYIIDSADIWEQQTEGIPPTYSLSIGAETCTGHSDGDACEQVLTIETGEGGGDGFPFPECTDDLIFELQLTMFCSDPLFVCDVPIIGGCSFHVSTSFCPELVLDADNVGAELNTYGQIEVDDNGYYFTSTETGTQTAFAYLNTIYYEMEISGLTGADVSVTEFIIEKLSNENTGEPNPTLTFNILDTTQPDPIYEEGGYTTPSINIMKEFNVEASVNRDSIIFKQIVNEFTFPEYPTDATNPISNYRVTCTVTNNGFQRRLQATINQEMLQDPRSLTENEFTGTRIVDIAYAPFDDGSENDQSENGEVNDVGSGYSHFHHIPFSSYLLTAATAFIVMGPGSLFNRCHLL